MEAIVIGLNHRTAPIAIREKLNIPKSGQPEFLHALRMQPIFSERVVLSTCNRSEIYGAGCNLDEDIATLKKFWSNYAQISPLDIEKQLYVLTGPYAVRHLFSVTSGLNSMVIGETEITGQVKDAYALAKEHKCTGKVLNRLFQQAFKVAKDIRTKTQIGAKKVSVASVAVDLAEKSFNGLEGLRVMVLGSGKMSLQVAKAMKEKGAIPVIVSRCPLGHDSELMMDFEAQFKSYEAFQEDIPLMDILIAATSAPEVLITKKKAISWMKVRHNRPLFLIDIAVPRNIAAEVAQINNVSLYNIDALQKIANQNQGFRQSQIASSFDLIQRQTQQYGRWFSEEFGEPNKRSTIYV